MEDKKETKQKTGGEQEFNLTPEPSTERAYSPQHSTRVLANKVIAYFGESFDKDVARLTAKERIDIYIKLAPFAMPKLQAATVDLATTKDALSQPKSQLIDLAKKFDKSKAPLEVKLESVNTRPQQAVSN